jgi:pyridoxine kinase
VEAIRNRALRQVNQTGRYRPPISVIGMAMNVTLSFHSHVVAGHVGNAVARHVFTLLGRELWEVPTVVFSNHPAGRSFAGETLASATMARMLAVLRENGLLASVDAVLSGYLRDPDHVGIIADVVPTVRAQSGRGARYVCDPVLGDRAQGLYVPAAVARSVAETLVPLADVLTPNHFELEYLTGAPAEDDAAVWSAAARLQAAGPQVVVVTSVCTGDAPDDRARTFMLAGENAWHVTTPLVNSPAHGAGDLLAAILAARLADGTSPPEALSLAVSGVYGVLRATGRNPDLQVLAAASEIVAPSQTFAAMSRPPASRGGG